MVYLTDPIGDLITRMRNAQHVRRPTCEAPWSRIKEQLCQIMKQEGFLEDVEVVGEAPKQSILVTFAKDKPKLDLKRSSTPGRRMYVGSDDVKPVMQGYGIAIITTSQGLMTDKSARKKKIGGEVLCTVA